MKYIYLWDRLTAPELRGMTCDPVLRADGKCIRGRNGSMLVVGVDGWRWVVLGRVLRKVK